MKTPPTPFTNKDSATPTTLRSAGAWSSATHAAGRGGAAGLTDPAPVLERATDRPSAACPGVIRVFYPFGVGGVQGRLSHRRGRPSVVDRYSSGGVRA
jgi:hypothetical protein